MGLFNESFRPLLGHPTTAADMRLRTKVWLLGAFAMLLFSILALQLLRLQVFRHDELALRATSNRLRLTDTSPVRGLIFARDGTIVAENIPGFAVTVIPADVPADQEHAVAAWLAPVLGIQAFKIETWILEGKRSIDPFQPVLLESDVESTLAFQLAAAHADLPGVEVIEVAKRSYLQGDLLASILGYLGPITREEFDELRADRYRLADRIGQTGIEAAYETVLRGVPGRQSAEVNASGRALRTLSEEQPTPGQGLVLTVDLALQEAVATILEESMGGSLFATAVVVDVETGEILAMVSLPTYDNNLFSGKVSDAELEALLTNEGRPLVNHAIADQFPPGSIFKVITGSAALQEGVVSADTIIRSPGVIEVQNVVDPRITYTFRDTTSGDFDFVTGLAESSNVYFWYLAGGSPYRRPVAEEFLTPEERAEQQQLIDAGIIGGSQEFEGLGVEQLARWAREFGLSEPTDIDLAGEASGFVPDAEWKRSTFGEGWGQGDSYNMGIGQGFVAVTPLQMAMVTAAIANGGDLLEPRLVREILDFDGNMVQAFRPQVKRYLDIAPEALALVRQGMGRAVLAGTAGNAYFREMQIGGKTGTAEFGAEEGFGGLFPTHGWFLGFAPFDEPRVAVAIFHQLGAGYTTAEAGGQILKAWAEMSDSIDPNKPAPAQRASLDSPFDMSPAP